MAKTLRKAQAKQHARIKDYNETLTRNANNPAFNPRSYRKPGSMKK